MTCGHCQRSKSPSINQAGHQIMYTQRATVRTWLQRRRQCGGRHRRNKHRDRGGRGASRLLRLLIPIIHSLRAAPGSSSGTLRLYLPWPVIRLGPRQPPRDAVHLRLQSLEHLSLLQSHQTTMAAPTFAAPPKYPPPTTPHHIVASQRNAPEAGTRTHRSPPSSHVACPGHLGSPLLAMARRG